MFRAAPFPCPRQSKDATLHVHHSHFKASWRKRPKKRLTAEEDILRLIQRHFPEYVPPTEKKAGPSRRCIVCSKRNVRRESRYQYSDCDIGLCAAPCFKVFHTEKNY
uniref:PiggyBac transposable element-derived protein 4 C-terminal zinc-finger domain-containing protein n=1 Tax=Homalodisca liturata TaxID=320908 RepID=A0A1B6J0L0_9HEMI